MTDQGIRKNITEAAILNDLLSIRLNELSTIDMNHKNLEKSVNRSRKSSLNLIKVMDSKLGDNRAEMFGEMYDKINELTSEIFEKVIG